MTMPSLRDLATVIRSKNAGPRLLTLDLMFVDADVFRQVSAASDTLRRAVAQRYALSEADVTVIPYPPALAIKITIPRRLTAGDPGDSDVYGAQQHAPLLDVCL